MKKSNLHVEEAKERRTSHWDLDLASHEELEAHMTQNVEDITPTLKEKLGLEEKPAEQS